ncbi:exodeoxyribonuclease V subunit gamma [Plasticicumulans acidivorans]|nr:exodeoxyribonuclease V subunit gamma [Plasticicumulans acidivorans]
MLTVIHSNRMETLADVLAAQLRAPLGDAFAAETLVVASNGLRRWLSLGLAERLGVCANLDWPLPSRLFWDLYRALLPEVPQESAYATPILAWRVLSECGRLADEAVFAPLAAYLERQDERGRYRLARRIADTFDQYLVYRPDWIEDWEQGGQRGADAADAWQPALWRRLVACGEPHRAQLHQRFLAALQARDTPPPGLPPRLSLIGIPALPAAWLETLQALARFLRIDLYLLNPCREYWGLIEAERTLARRLPDSDPAEAYLETGNRLLASTGRLGRDFHHQLAELGEQMVRIDAFDPPEPQPAEAAQTLLQVLQSDMLELRERGERGLPRYRLRADDDSVQLHVCHGRLREIEVLHERLLALFAAHPALGPADVVVMTPDIDAYAAAIEAVFAGAEQRMPFDIVDRTARAENRTLDAVFRLLDMPDSRFEADAVVSLLEVPALRRRFGIAADELDSVRDWLSRAGVRWAWDGAQRAALGLPAQPEHSWRWGLDRLLLGSALPTGGRALYAGLLPVDAPGGEAARLVGRLAHFAAELAALRERLSGRCPPAQWRTRLEALLDGFLLAEDASELAAVQQWRDALQRLEDTAVRAGFDAAVPLAAVRDFVLGELGGERGNAGLRGGITFCRMVPMRAIPFEVVCVIGLNDGEYPRRASRRDFDLLLRQPRRGDRSPRNEDRYLFLEALLSARQVFYMSYVGRSARDDAELPPSVLVAELLDTIGRSCVRADEPTPALPRRPGDRARDPLALIRAEHPLQAFSPRAFDGADARLASHSPRLAGLARRIGRGQRLCQRLFAGEPLPPPPAELLNVTPERLIGFYSHPARYLLRERLGLRFEELDGALAHAEPFRLDEDWGERALRTELLSLRREDCAADDARRLVAAAGWLPHGAIGRLELDGASGAVDKVIAALPPASADCEPCALHYQHAGVTLSGWLRELRADGRLLVVAQPLGWRERLTAWIGHLLLQLAAAERPDITPHTCLVGSDTALRLKPLANAAAELDMLLAGYASGLRAPLPFVPPCAWAAARESDSDAARQAARRKWEGGYNSRFAYRDEAYYAAAFSAELPLDACLDWGTRIFAAIEAARSEEGA